MAWHPFQLFSIEKNLQCLETYKPLFWRWLCKFILSLNRESVGQPASQPARPGPKGAKKKSQPKDTYIVFKSTRNRGKNMDLTLILVVAQSTNRRLKMLSPWWEGPTNPGHLQDEDFQASGETRDDSQRHPGHPGEAVLGGQAEAATRSLPRDNDARILVPVSVELPAHGKRNPKKPLGGGISAPQWEEAARIQAHKAGLEDRFRSRVRPRF